MLDVRNPATDAVIARLETDDAASIAAKFARARAAQAVWRQTPYERRAQIVRRFRELLERDGETLAHTLTAEVGKPTSQARNEVKGTLSRIDFFLAETASRLAERVVLDDQAAGVREVIGFEPIGVVANVSAWNYPYFVGSNVFVPALLTGNAVLYKPSELAALTGREIARLWGEAGLPSGVFELVIGGGEAGQAVIDQPVDGVFFTGSYATGRKLMERLAGRMIRIQCELGGKDPVYVRPDVDVQIAAEATADGAFYNAGQSCCGVERLYVHADIFDAFVDAFVTFTKGLKSGDPTADGVYFGPLTRPAQLAVLEDQLHDAQQKGAQVLTGGRRRPGQGAFFEPTVVVNVDHRMKLMRDESFGPVIGIQKVQDDAEAIRLMNDTDYGLTAGVYTRDEAKAQALLAELNAGSVYWNCCDRVSPRLPWSGRGHSGVGATLSVLGIDAFLKPKAWHLKRA